MESLHQKRKLAGAAAIVISALILSRITGFLESMFIPNFFTNDTLDAYQLSFSITEIMYNLIISGAIASSLIPILSGYLSKDQEEEGWKAVSTFINVILIFMIFICILGMIFSKQIVYIIGHNTSIEAKNLAIPLTRILFPSVAFMMLAGLANGVLNSYKRFAAAAYGPSIYNLGCALSILFLHRFGVRVVVYGVLASAIFYFFFQFTFVIKNLKFYKFMIMLKHPGFKKLYKQAIPSLTSSSVMLLNGIISIFFVAKYGRGSVGAYKSANDIWQFSFGIFAVGIGTAILPSLSENLSKRNFSAYKVILTKGINMVILFAVPSAVGTAVLNIPIMSVIFKQSSNVNSIFISKAGIILLFFSIAIIFSSLQAIINRAYFSNNDTKTPLYVGIMTIALTIMFNIVFYKFTTLKEAGMSLAYSLAGAINLIVLMFILNKRKLGVNLKKLFDYITNISIAALIMGVVIFLLNKYSPVDFNEWGVGSKFKTVGYLFVEIITGIGVYSFIIFLLRVPEGKYMLELIINRIKYLQYILKNIFK